MSFGVFYEGIKNILEVFFYLLDEMVLLVCYVTASTRFAQLWRAQTAQTARCKISKWPFLRLFFLFLGYSLDQVPTT
jgi:hypothetical protein